MREQQRRGRGSMMGMRQAYFFFASLLLMAATLPGTEFVFATKSGEWTDCLNGASGLCIDTTKYTCSGTVLSGKCAGGADIKCCPSGEGYNKENDVCKAEGTGAVCKKSGDCTGTSTTVSNKCVDAPAGVKCCVPPANNGGGTTQNGEWTDCLNGASGLCIDTTKYTCSGTVLSGKCAGGADIKCCPSGEGYNKENDVCKAEGTGAVCKKSGDCTGTSTTVSNKCVDAPAGVKCCVPPANNGGGANPDPNPDPNPNPGGGASQGNFLPTKPDVSGSTGKCTTPYQKFSGDCIDVSKCTGGTFKGLCSGSSSIMCCVAETTSTPQQDTPSMSLDQFKKLFTGISAVRAAAFWPYFLTALKDGNIKTCHEIAAFVGQIGHESAGLRYFEELASGSAYNGRSDLGNTQPGDGPRFKGRGPIQLTGRANYRSAGQDLSMDFETRPEQVCLPSAGFKAAVWFWTKHNLNQYCTGQYNDFVGLTRRINGGTNGLTDRVNRWEAAKKLLQCPASTANHKDTASTGEWSVCSGNDGLCFDKSQYQCSGAAFTTGKCAGGNDIVCCPKPGGVIKKDNPDINDKCAKVNGKCMLASQCDGTSTAGLCAGPSAVKCCYDPGVEEEEDDDDNAGNGDADPNLPDNSEDGCKVDIPTHASRSCPKARQLTKVCKELGGGTTSEPPSCTSSTTTISSKYGWVCKENSNGKRAANWQFADSSYSLSATSRSKMLTRAKAWVDEGIRYSQRRYHLDSTTQALAYRTDCSGFISMAWQLPVSVATSYLCCTTSSKLFERVNCDDLQPGDALVTQKKGHVILFHSWANTKDNSDGEFIAWEEAGHSSGTIERKWSFHGKPPSDPKCKIGLGASANKDYLCIRRKAVAGVPPCSAPPKADSKSSPDSPPLLGGTIDFKLSLAGSFDPATACADNSLSFIQNSLAQIFSVSKSDVGVSKCRVVPKAKARVLTVHYHTLRRLGTALNGTLVVDVTVKVVSSEKAKEVSDVTKNFGVPSSLEHDLLISSLADPSVNGGNATSSLGQVTGASVLGDPTFSKDNSTPDDAGSEWGEKEKMLLFGGVGVLVVGILGFSIMTRCHGGSSSRNKQGANGRVELSAMEKDPQLALRVSNPMASGR